MVTSLCSCSLHCWLNAVMFVTSGRSRRCTIVLKCLHGHFLARVICSTAIACDHTFVWSSRTFIHFLLTIKSSADSELLLIRAETLETLLESLGAEKFWKHPILSSSMRAMCQIGDPRCGFEPLSVKGDWKIATQAVSNAWFASAILFKSDHMVQRQKRHFNRPQMNYL